jgi:hypothetical protein
MDRTTSKRSLWGFIIAAAILIIVYVGVAVLVAKFTFNEPSGESFGYTDMKYHPWYGGYQNYGDPMWYNKINMNSIYDRMHDIGYLDENQFY